MATQGQRRAEAKSAVRRLRAEYRKADSAGEKAERELDRLIKRKTLIGADDLQTVAKQLYSYAQAVESIQRIYILVQKILQQVEI